MTSTFAGSNEQQGEEGAGVVAQPEKGMMLQTSCKAFTIWL